MARRVSGCLKYSMFIFNFLFWICGCVILGVAIWLRVSKSGKEIITSGSDSGNAFVAVNILIAVGAIIMVMGFLGCCGAMNENRCMLLLFFIALLLILLLQIIAGILGAVFKDKSVQALNETLHRDVNLLSETGEEGKDFREAVSAFQEELHCCGLVDGPADWGSNFQQISKTCECQDGSSDNCMSYNGINVYKKTCTTLIKDAVEKNILIIIGIAFGLAAIEVIGLVFSMILYCQIGNK